MTTVRRMMLSVSVTLATFGAMAAPSVLDIKHSLRDDNVRPPESFETQTRALEENFFLRHYTDARPNSIEPRFGNADEYTRKLQELGTEIEMPYNPVVGRLIDLYLGKRRGLVSNMLALHDYYGDIFIEELEKEGMPLELQYLPVIESAINPNAVSRAGAAGLWQFMPATARGLGMEVSSLVDERRDPRQASRNAARYLHQLFDIYGDWSLAIAAYNCGPGNVNKALRRAGGGKKDFWEIYNFLPSETRGYVPAFIAANYVMNYHNDYGIHRPVVKRPLVTDTVMVSNRVHFDQIANVLDIPVEEIRMLNPQFRKDVIPGTRTNPYALVLPSMQALSYISSQDAILAYDAERYNPRATVDIGLKPKVSVADTGAVAADSVQSALILAQAADTIEKRTHVVGRGEDLGSIAKRYGVSATDIKHWNNLRRGKVREGQELVIEIVKPRSTVASPTVMATVSTTNNAVPVRKVAQQPVRKVDQQQVPPRRVQQEGSARTSSYNPPTRNSERYQSRGQGATSRASSRDDRKTSKTSKNNDNGKSKQKNVKQAKPKSYDVKSGDNFERIAKKHGISTEELMRANKRKGNDTRINPGDKIVIPSKSTPAAKSAKNGSPTRKDAKKGAKNETKKSASKSTKSSSKSSSKKKK